LRRAEHTRKQRLHFAHDTLQHESWYDLIDDYELIEASFAQQYGIRLRNEDEMQWDEFSSLLAGLNEKTPLGRIVSIRSETNPDMLKHFTPEMKRIRSEWRNKQATERVWDKQAYDAEMQKLAEAFRRMAGD